MALVSFIANLERLTVAVERLSLDVSHGIRILENVFPLAHAEARWKPPSEELHIADDQALLDEEAQARHEAGLPSQTEEDRVAPGYDPWNL